MEFCRFNAILILANPSFKDAWSIDNGCYERGVSLVNIVRY